MANEITKHLQEKIKELMDSFDTMRNEGKDLFNVYWKGSVNSDITGEASGTQVGSNTPMTKNELANMLTVIEQMDNFWENVVVVQGDYQANLQNALHPDSSASDPAGGLPISQDVEDFCDRAKQFATDMITQYNKGRDINSDYVNSEVSVAVAAISVQTVVFGADMTKDDLTSAITLIGEFIDFIENAAVTQGDYKATVAKWQRL